jgi:uncharacterized protein (DUF1015 family)
MATVRPFHGITFDPTRVPDLSRVTCPPYDVISPADRDELYERDPYNIVRIVSGRDETGDDEAENKYTRACGFFRSWLWEGVLHEDPDTALYVYRQAFTDPQGSRRRVWGLLGTISLDDEILAHEKTMPGPKADRLALMRSTPANLSPIYALYREDGGAVSEALSEFAHDAPVADFVDDEGTRHTAWAVHDQAFQEKVAAALHSSPLLIADGHHRFETAKAYRDLRRAEAGAGPWDSTLALLVDVSAQPVCILPYHRILLRTNDPDPVATVDERFVVEEIGKASPETVNAFAQGLWEAERGSFGFLHGGSIYRLQPRNVEAHDIPAGILAREALAPLGVGSAQDDLAFTPDPEIIRTAVEAGEAAGGFLIPPVDVERVWDLAAGGATMPEKSTYFFPKPRDGIVVRPIEPC